MFTSRLALDMSTEEDGHLHRSSLKVTRGRSTLRYTVILRPASFHDYLIFSWNARADPMCLSWLPHQHALPAARYCVRYRSRPVACTDAPEPWAPLNPTRPPKATSEYCRVINTVIVTRDRTVIRFAGSINLLAVPCRTVQGVATRITQAAIGTTLAPFRNSNKYGIIVP